MPAVEFDLAAVGYGETEMILEGTADSFLQVGQRGADGKWSARVGSTARYATRVIIRHPLEAQRCSGAFIVEWLNVSSGSDVSPDWTYLHRHIMRQGHVWAGVSAQRVGVEGGGILQGDHLKQAAPERYNALSHPGDAWAFDIFSDAGRMLRSTTGYSWPTPTYMLATGHSQSAAFLSTYINAIDPTARVYDGFLIHGWGGSGPRLDGFLTGGRGTDPERARRNLVANPAAIRNDARVPVVLLQSETDTLLMPSDRVREADSSNLRVWEIAGTAHGDSYLMSGGRDDGRLSAAALADIFAATSQPTIGALTLPEREVPINGAPQHHYVAHAALECLSRWAVGGSPPPHAPRLVHPLRQDNMGIAVGGIRTPWVEVPTATMSGAEGHALGTTRPFSDEVLHRLYPGGGEEYLIAFRTSLDSTITEGFLLEEDRTEILGLAVAALPAALRMPDNAVPLT
ncbi:alpha/beta hydrolase domain-containing protein [Mycobacterium terramassiliense]|nr:alpha/beta hydrolase domain-containing protein [Mycobacterium terramassiliense]